MLIDWFTVVAQILNFLILVWLLKRFLYKPVLKAVKQREERINHQLQEAEATMEKAEEERQAFRQKKEQFEATRAGKLEEVAEEARKSRQRLLAEARDEAAALRSQLIESVRDEKKTLDREISKRMQAEIFAISRKLLRDLASAELEEQVVRTFVKRLRDIDGAEREHLAEALGRHSEAVVVRSAFELPEAQEREIALAVEKLAGEKLPCRFETTADKILGIELTAGGHKMAWSVAEYLDSLEKALSEILREEAQESSSLNPKSAADEPS
ncbi:MAG TPA: hypothetical protein VJ933_12780 [Phaeodactylibacter sp.]|nr:hypothetical protein [Phaeodactylibacter sp.]